MLLSSAVVLILPDPGGLEAALFEVLLQHQLVSGWDVGWGGMGEWSEV